ncbi:putative metal-binding protein [Salmonella enterica subsp. enterica serovar Sanjuan]|uniref:Putative metal-binding protein n=1 Tax=Salmonella enterica subsp. enterica serovar Sanjuan TaxID=1160765 RepID=A0A447NRP8_SALET|nr:putative metal-binding protein [Salmonella enterica subsp. enterica serovar Sanjuan]
MDSIHGHEVLNMMIESGEQYTHTSLGGGNKSALWRAGTISHLFSVKYDGGGTGRVSGGERKVYCGGGRFFNA